MTPYYVHRIAAVTTYNPSDAPVPLFDIFVAGTAADRFICMSYIWSPGTWSECSVDCGVGTRTRSVACMDESGATVDSSFCSLAAKPPTVTVCNRGACVWVPTAWSDCTNECGGGTQMRNLECRNGGGSGLRVIDGNCYSGTQPAITQLCNTAACLPLFWSPSSWSACSVQ